MLRRWVSSSVILAAALLPAASWAVLGDQARLGSLYRQALASWAIGDEEAALALLQRIDEASLAGGRGASRVAAAKMAAARALARREHDAVLAIVRLEQRAYTA
ncbi:MAG TPA: hypothetical protein VGV61_13130, partial [Thermoanaerobaculia bacterium]|nr:hypothetical protein [Thermoanaerobaculia bacterium]